MSSAPTILSTLSALADALPPDAKVLILTTPRRRFVAALETILAPRAVEVFSDAKVHVPEAVVDAAETIAKTFAPTVLLTLGGGAATGLGKALKQRGSRAQLVSVATTYAGSEMTRIWGVTTDAAKQTGRDDAVRPTVVVHDVDLVDGLPRALAVQSLINTLAHPLSALSAGIDAPDAKAAALHAVRDGVFALRQAIAHHAARDVKASAFAAVRAAGRVLDANPMGAHHKIAHALGGSFDLDHAALHAVLLPHSIAKLRDDDPALMRAIAATTNTPDLAAFVHDALTRVQAPTALKDLKISRSDDAITWTQVADATKSLDVPVRTLRNAFRGARPTLTARDDVWHGVDVVVDGDLNAARRVVVALHGRGSTAAKAVARVREAVGHGDAVAIVGPQSEAEAWVDAPYRVAGDVVPSASSTVFASAVSRVQTVLAALNTRAPNTPLGLFGFSQGACLGLEVLLVENKTFDSVVAVSGALAPHRVPQVAQAFANNAPSLKVALSIAKEDAWVDVDDVEATAEALRTAGAEVQLRVRPGAAHKVTDADRLTMRDWWTERAPGAHGYGGHHLGESLDGAVPRAQNSPRHSPYGLMAEQVSGTGFVAARHENMRTWTYRIRPSAQHSSFEELSNSRFTSEFVTHASVNLAAWDAPAPAPEPQDFVDSMVTLGGAGHPGLRRGYAVHVYNATADMDDRAFTNADGDMLILPQEGALNVLTEMGSVRVAPGELMVVPRGLRITVLLETERARGYVGEVFARHFHLPERGLIGHNALADERHFRAPQPFYEDRLSRGYRLTNKLGGKVYEAKQDYSPYDVVGWHGSYLPYVYDTRMFAPVSNTLVDHADPSVYTVLSAGLDEPGAHALDLVVFPARWDPTENTFRPPYFHRNVTTEINGIIEDPAVSAPFAPGMLFVTPSMTAHGIRARAVENYLRVDDVDANRPRKSSRSALWFQLETALPFHPTPWAAQAAERREGWDTAWGEYPSTFTPPSPATRSGNSNDDDAK